MNLPELPNPRTAALQLLKAGLKVSEYENGVQADRKKRLETFNKVGIPVLIEMEEKLIAYGEEVISNMKLFNLMKFMKESE